MEPLLRKPVSIFSRLINRIKKAGWGKKEIVAGVLCALALCVFTGITIARTEVYIKDDDQTYIVYTFSNSPEEILKSQSIVLSDKDSYICSDLGDNKLEIIVNRAFDVSVTADGTAKTVKMSKGTAADALELAGVEVSGTDRINVALTEELIDDTSIIVDRVAVKTQTKKTKIKFKSVVKKTSSLLKGERVVSQKGKKGVSVTKTQNVYVNGELESSKVISKKTTKKAVKQVVLVGTKKAVGVDEVYGSGKLKYKGKTLKYSKVLVGSATAYSAGKNARTASGRHVKYGNVAVNPNVIPYGTKLFIKTAGGSFIYGKAVAADTGSALMSGSALVDLYFNSNSQCYSFGRRQVEVYILK